MFKLFGALGIFISSLIFGFSKAHTLKKRCESLKSLTRAFERIAAETSFTKKRLERIFAETAREYNLPIFADTAFKLQKSGIKSAWEDSLTSYAEEMALTESDQKAALTLSSLGDYTGSEQEKCLKTAEKLLKLSLQDAEECYQKSAKLYRSSGLLFGLLAVILLF